MVTKFKDRRQAGILLAERLVTYAYCPNLYIVGLPNGGIITAHQIAVRLKAPIDLLNVRKLSVPGCAEMTLGALATGCMLVLNKSVLDILDITDEQIKEVVFQAQNDLIKYEEFYRGNRSPLDLINRSVMLVDDGISTGATMHAAIKAIKNQSPATIIVATPIVPQDIYQELTNEVDEVISLIKPPLIEPLAQYYDQFDDVTDQQVYELINRSHLTMVATHKK